MSGCGGGSADPGCAGFEPIVPQAGWEQLPRWVKEEIVKQNEVGEKNCGWKP